MGSRNLGRYIDATCETIKSDVRDSKSEGFTTDLTFGRGYIIVRPEGRRAERKGRISERIGLERILCERGEELSRKAKDYHIR